MDVDDHRRRSAGLGELLDADGEGKCIESCATVFARDQDSQQAGFGSRPDRLLWEAAVSIYFSRKRKNDALGELTDRCTKVRVLGAEFEIQLGVN